jgi:hypothetical protein
MRKLTESEQAIVRSHTLWIDTNGREGACADFSGANLNYADLSDLNLSKANFSGAQLVYANLSNTYLSFSNFSSANLAEANLSRSYSHKANLAGARLVKADLSYACFSNVNLENVQLRETILVETNLVDCQNVTEKTFGVKTDPLLPQKVAMAVNGEYSKLYMGDWHICETTHCLAGWAIHLSGAAGYALEKATSPSVAGAMLMPSAAHLFGASNEKAMEWLQEQLAT